jgi:hypothetical protein
VRFEEVTRIGSAEEKPRERGGKFFGGLVLTKYRCSDEVKKD